MVHISLVNDQANVQTVATNMFDILQKHINAEAIDNSDTESGELQVRLKAICMA